MAGADPGILADLLSRVNTESAAVLELLERVARDAGIPTVVGHTDPEDIPELPSSPITRSAGLWMLGAHRLPCADSTDPVAMERLMDGERARVLWTDPPYGVSYVGKTAKALGIANDQPEGLQELLRSAFAAADPHLEPGAAIYVAHPAGPASLVFGQAFIDQGWRWHQSLAWVKDSSVLGHSDYPYRHEPLLFGYKPGPGRWGRGAKGWYGGNDQTSVLEVPRPKASREHPTAKPVELIRMCLANSSKDDEAVLDPFCGSGSTLIAAEMLGRRGFGVELDAAYCDVAVHRWEAFTGSKAVRM